MRRMIASIWSSWQRRVRGGSKRQRSRFCRCEDSPAFSFAEALAHTFFPRIDYHLSPTMGRVALAVVCSQPSGPPFLLYLRGGRWQALFHGGHQREGSPSTSFATSPSTLVNGMVSKARTWLGGSGATKPI